MNVSKSFKFSRFDNLPFFSRAKDGLVAEALYRGHSSPELVLADVKRAILELDDFLKIQRAASSDPSKTKCSAEIEFVLHLLIQGLFEAIKQHNFYAENLVVHIKIGHFSLGKN